MRKFDNRLAVVTALLPLALGGCASHDTAQAAAAKPASTAPTAAAATPATAPPSAAVPQAARPAPRLPPPSQLEAETGIQVAQVGLTAQGGLVDVRFKVLDAQKARALLSNPANVPTLIAGDKPPLMAPHQALKGARFSKGQVFFILYPNVRRAVEPGMPVTVAMGPVRLGPVTAQ
jgi:pyruvate/2-oxoglutarate dehydrogenase complex dihydrolipoamide acyltransferase (E2) component